ncbi:MAG: cyclic nucleotide-binding domain-containing protein [Cyanobacteria bacterium J06626_6]
MQSLSFSELNIRFDRLTQLLLLAVTVLVYNVLGMAIANSLFVSYVGAQQLPIAFMLIGLCSMPAYAVFSQIVDSYSRPQLFRYVLLGSVFVMFGLRLLLTQDAPYAYYILLIAIFFQWDFHNNVLYPSLLTDYFTTLEYKRYAPYIGIAQAVGTLLGGGLTAVLSHYLRTRDLLLCLPVVFLIGFAQLVYLEGSQRRVNSDEPGQSIGILESIRTFPDLVKRYPLALFLAASSFLLVIIYISSEFLWFNIYGSRFSDQALTGFLGVMRIVISLVQVAVIYGVTRPLLKTLGVAQMNPVYPLTTLASFAGLLTHFGLPAAIGLHVNGDGLYKGINIPVHQLNYNAIPREFIGRIRALSDGLIYSVGLTLAGALLWVAETRLSLVQIAWVVAGLTVGLLLVRLPMGRYYASGLEAMIRSDGLDLDAFDLMPVSLNPQSAEAVKELLRDGDRYSQLKGLELAARMGAPGQFLAEVDALMRRAGTQDAQLMEGAIALFAPCSTDLQAHFQQALAEPPLREFALEVLLINQALPEAADSLGWLTDATSQLATSARANGNGYSHANGSADSTTSAKSLTQHSAKHQVLAALAHRLSDPATQPAWPTLLTSEAARIITRVVAYSQNPDLASLIPDVVLTQKAADILRTGLEALVPLAQRGDRATADIASHHLTHADPMVRIAALDLLRVTTCPETLTPIGECLSDPDPRVREQAAKAIAAFGQPGVDLAKTHLAPAVSPTPPATVNAAITAIGLVRTRAASNVLFDYLSPRYAQLAKTRRWQSQIPADASSWEALRVAIADSHDRLIQKVLYVLSALGYARTVNAVNRLLATGAQSELENAIEVLASLNHRRFVLPLMPLFEQLVATPPTLPLSAPPLPALPQANPPTQVTPQWLKTKGYRLLLEALESNDRWIKSGALVALVRVPAALVNDPDPFVKQIASQIFQENLPVTTAMNRLLLLKTIRLFKNLSLDELMLIDESLEQTQVIAGETIFTEGDLAAHLYIVAEGDVQLIKDIDGVPRSLKQITKGDYFGEVALFDDAPLWDSAIAQTDCTLLKLEKNRFLSLITQRPHMILEICRFLSQRLRETDKVRSENASGVR